jgi:peptidoglycan/xylan/chitin deacetylase (PgdA/CDA1 family)
MHMFSAIRAKCGPSVLLREINKIQERYKQGPPLASLDSLMCVMRAWPQAEKDHWAAAIWMGAGMGSVDSFLNQYRPYFSVEGLRDWVRRGHEVGFHTHSHPFCSRLTDELWETEVVKPVADLESAVGVQRIAFAYPFGDRSPPEHEAKLRRLSLFTTLMGTAGFSKRQADLSRMERIGAEDGVDFAVFGRPVLRASKQWLKQLTMNPLS